PERRRRGAERGELGRRALVRERRAPEHGPGPFDPVGKTVLDVVVQRLRPTVVEDASVGLERDVRVDERRAPETAPGEHADVVADMKREERARVTVMTL